MTERPPDSISLPPPADGWELFCDGVLQTEFGRRPSQALSKAMTVLTGESAQRGWFNRWREGWEFSGGLRWAAGSVVLLVAAVIGLRFLSTRPPVTPVALDPRPITGVLSATNGDVQVMTGRHAPPVPVHAVNFTVHDGEVIQVGSNATARFTYADGSALAIYRQSEIVVGCTNSGLTLEVRRGAVDADIRPQPAGHDMQVTTRFLRADILGTEFRLMTDTESAWLGVRQGKIEVTRVSDGKKVVLLPSNYAAVHPQWPYMQMDARVCPVWKGVCRQAAGTPYP